MVSRVSSPLALVLPFVISVLSCGIENSNGSGTANSGLRAGGLCGAGCVAPKVCDPALGCVDCQTDENCPTAKPHCVRGACAVCATNEDCPASIHACSLVNHVCQAACGPGSGVTCPAGTQCDPKGGTCVVCRSDDECAGTERPICDPVRGACVACLTDENCAASAPICSKLDAVCVQCVTNGDCPASAPTCTADLRCRAGCLSDESCRETAPYCNLGTGECQQCRSNSECGDAALPFCAEGRCVECLQATTCSAALPFCKVGRCVACQADGDCPTQTPRCTSGSCGP
jgi:hypothetical protein